MLHCYTRKNAQLVTNLQQTCSKSVATTCWQDVLALVVPSLLTRLLQACSRLATSLMNTTALLQVCSNNLLSGCNQQLVNKLWVTNLVQLDKITALLQTCWQACYKLLASTTCWQVVRFCVCTWWSVGHMITIYCCRAKSWWLSLSRDICIVVCPNSWAFCTAHAPNSVTTLNTHTNACRVCSEK